MKAYKVFNSDWTCNGFQYKMSEIAELKTNALIICNTGFHFCPKLVDCFNHYDFDPKNKIAEIEILGDIVWAEDKKKGCTNKLKLVREISWHECLDLVNIGSNNTGNGNSGNRNSGNRNSGNRNSGDRNSGNRNSGNRNSGNRNSDNGNSGDWNSGNGNSGNGNSGNGNSGNRNSGDRNSGDRNSGDRNSGDWNKGSYQNGYCNTKNPKKIYVFDRLIDKSKWEQATIPHFFYDSHVPQNWKVAYRNASQTDQKQLLQLPNFDKKIWLELTGIDLDHAETWLFDDHIGLQSMMGMFDA